MDGQEHEPEAWMERNVNGVLAGTHAAQQLAADAADREAGGDGQGHEQQSDGQFQHSHVRHSHGVSPGDGRAWSVGAEPLHKILTEFIWHQWAGCVLIFTMPFNTFRRLPWCSRSTGRKCGVGRASGRPEARAGGVGSVGAGALVNRGSRRWRKCGRTTR